jgi:hypothetical protein
MTTGQIDPALLTLLVFLALGGVAVYVAYRNQALGAALLVGVGVVTLLYLVAANPPEPRPATPPSPALTAPAVPPGTATPAQPAGGGASPLGPA